MNPLVDVIAQHVPLRPAGLSGWKWKGLCPFHEERTPSFVLDEKSGFWYCFGCCTGGDVKKFVQRIVRKINAETPARSV